MGGASTKEITSTTPSKTLRYGPPCVGETRAQALNEEKRVTFEVAV